MKNLLLFTGEETFLIREKIRIWKKEFIKKHGGDINIAHIDAEKESISKIIAECHTMPFLAEKRLIFIENFPPSIKSPLLKSKDKLKTFIDTIENPPSSSVIVFVNPGPDKRTSVYKKIQKCGKIVEFPPLKNVELHKWIYSAAKELGIVIQNTALHHLIESCGNNLWKLHQELKKLSLYITNSTVTKQDIDSITIPHFEQNIFSITDALGQKNVKFAMKSLKKLVSSGEDLTHMFYIIIRQFRLILQIKDHYENQQKSLKEIVASIRIPPFVVKNILKQISFFHWRELKTIYQSLLEIDSKLKTGKIEIGSHNQELFIQEIETFIIKNCTQKKF